jgi:hypothetical protein
MKTKHGVTWPLAALAVLLAVVGVLAQGDTARAAGSFNPTITMTISDPTAGANADVVRLFEVPAGDYNYDVTIDFTPTAFALGTNVPIGAWVGSLEAVSTLGLLNNPCQTTLPVTFRMLNATLDQSTTVTFENSYALGADGLPEGATKYPEFLKTIFPGLTPTARLFGMASASGTPVTMNAIIFEPGTTVFGKTFDASLGRIVANVLNNPAAMLAPNPITDFCTPLSAKVTTFGIAQTDATITPVQGGAVVSTNPTTPGDYTFTTFDSSMLDPDGDGLESYRDTCPYAVDTGVDTDKDGIDNVCDPTPDENTNASDHDNDLYLNRGDLCPLVANTDQADADQDDIGDVCDTNPNTPDGEAIERSPTSIVTITGGAAAATPTVAPTGETPVPTVIQPAVTPTAAAKVTPTVAAKVTPTVAAKVTPTVAAKVTPTPVSGGAGGGGLLGSDGGFPVWAICIIAVAAALMLGSMGMVATVVRHRRP